MGRKTGMRALGWLLTLAVTVITLMGLAPVALADTSVSYRKATPDPSSHTVSYSTESVSTYTTVDSTTTNWNVTEGGWYVVSGNVTIINGVNVSGDVHLVLCDGATLTAKQGIHVQVDNSLTIYGQSGGTGKLVATGSAFDAGIGGYYSFSDDEATIQGGDVTIHGGTVTATGDELGAGIGGGGAPAGDGGSGGEVTIYGGTVTAISEYGAGIGGGGAREEGHAGSGGEVTIYGGAVTATGSGFGAGIGGGGADRINDGASGGKVTIHGGNVTATGTMYGAGIGGGGSQGDAAGSGGEVTIHGGTVTAKGGDNGAGIGGGGGDSAGGAGGWVIINGGTVTATGVMYGAGIGGGGSQYNNGGSGSDVTIHGGTVTATGGDFGAGIGGGGSNESGGSGGNVAIYGGEVTAVAGYSGADVDDPARGIGGGLNSGYGSYDGNVTIGKGVTVEAGKDAEGAIVVADYGGTDKHGQRYVHTYAVQTVGYQRATVDSSSHRVTYETREHGCIAVEDDSAAWGVSGGELWYAVTDDVEIGSRVTVTGDVHLILCDGAKLTASNGIQVLGNNSLTIYGQVKSTGELVATGTENNAGIGGDRSPGGKISIHGGDIIATGGMNGAGIGGGYHGYGGEVTICGGTVTAKGGDNGAGIGGGNGNGGGVVTIHGGAVTAKGGINGAGIGGGDDGYGGEVTIHGGAVTATGGSYGAGIGGGRGGEGGRVTIYGGIVTAVVSDYGSYNYGAGIGGGGVSGGNGGDGGEVTIHGGTVTATSGSHGAGIGGGGSPAGNGGNGGEVTIHGGTVTATSGKKGAGIGGGGASGGNGGNGGEVTIHGGTITATGGSHGAGIGGGASGSSGGKFTIYGGEVTALGGNITDARGIGGTAKYDDVGTVEIGDGVIVEAGDSAETASVVADYGGYEHSQHYVHAYFGKKVECQRAIVDNSSHVVSYVTESRVCTVVTDSDTVWKDGWYAVTEDVTLSERVTVTGDVHLILCDGATLIANGGIRLQGDGNSLTIYGQTENTGQLVATGIDDCAGIGGDVGNASDTVTIHGGTVTATGGSQGAGIGGGNGGAGGTVTVNGGEVTAVGGDRLPSGQSPRGIGGGASGASGTVIVAVKVYVSAGDDKSNQSDVTGIYGGSSEHEQHYVYANATPTVRYLNPSKDDDNRVTFTEESEKCTIVTANDTAWEAGWYAVTRDVILSKRVEVKGDVHLILSDGATLTSNQGIRVESYESLTIYGQTEGTGRLIATGTYGCAGIGGGYYNGIITNPGSLGSLTVCGGEVTSTGGAATGTTGKNGGAGIGASSGASGGTVTVYGGTVNAAGGAGAAGIGSGGDTIGSSGGTVSGSLTVYGGTVTATGGQYGAGIGGGYHKKGWTFENWYGTVTATGGQYGAGIGSGSVESTNDSAGTTTIQGGVVKAYGGENAAGIGGGGDSGGTRGRGGSVTINAGDVTAVGGGSTVSGSTTRGIGGGQKNNNNGTVSVGTGVIVKAGPDESNLVDVTSTFARKHEEHYVHAFKGVATPNATFEATGYGTGTLKDVEAGMKYILDGWATWTNVDDSDDIELTELSPCTIRVVRKGNGTTTVDSDAQVIDVDRADKPTGITVYDCTTLEDNDGRITGVTTSMEYQKQGESTWNTVTETTIDGLKPGTYHVRVRASGWKLASDSQVLEVGECAKHSVTLTGGEHATPAPEAGVSQTLAQGDQMATVTYTAKDGYEFPATSEHYRAMNGITVARTSDTVVTVSGTPTADVSVTVPNAIGNVYAVTLDRNGADNGDERVDATFGSAMPQATMPTRTDKTFAGYYDEKEGGTKYYNADGSSARTWDKTNGSTLFARWTDKQKAPEPNVTFNATGYSTGTLSGMQSGMRYRVDDGAWTYVDGTDHTEGIELTRLSPCTIQVVTEGDGINTTDSDALEIHVTREDKPTGIAAYGCTTPDNNDGRIAGVTSSMEYQKSGDDHWTEGNGDDVCGLTPGTYCVRVKGSGWKLASDSQELRVTWRFSVTLTSSEHATVDFDAYRSQTLEEGTSMSVVRYTADTGYRFATFVDFTNNGISVSRMSETVVQVSGTPTADACVTVPDAVPRESAVTLKGQGATTAGTESVIATYDSAMPKATMPTRIGYKFVGYFDAENGGTRYYNADGSSARAWDKAVDTTTLHARWTASAYTVILDRQGATTGASSVTATYEDSMPTAAMPERAGYTFEGYFDAEDGGTKYYNADGSSAHVWDKAANAALHARWTANTYTVRLDGQGATTAGDESVAATFDGDMPPATMPTRTGYTFGGYYDGRNGMGTQYYDADGSSAQVWDKAADMTLYATWVAKTYAVNLDAPGATTAGTAGVTATYGAAMPTAAMPTRTGYTFGGYYDGENGTGTQYYDADGSSASAWDKDEAVTLHARWTANAYTVKLENQGATTAGASSVTATYGAAMPTAAMPTRTGYTFGGYYDGENGTGTQYYDADGTSARAWDKAADAALYARWTANTYTVTLDNQSATTPGASSVTATYGAALPGIEGALPARTDHTFAGYFSQADGGGTQYLNADGTATESTWLTDGPGTLYAQWTANPKEGTPTATFTASGYDTGTLSGVEAGMRYKVGSGEWKDIDNSDVIVLTGLSPCTIWVVKKGNHTTTTDSDAQEIRVTKAQTPDLVVTQPTVIGGKGSIATTTDHEYSSDNGGSWTTCAANQQLAAGTYLVRVRAAGAMLASGNQTVKIEEFEPGKEAKPGAAFTATGSDTGTLSGVAAGMKYSLDGGATWHSISSSLVVSLSGLSAGTIQVVRKGNGTTTVDSDAQVIKVTKAAKPTAPRASDCTTLENNDGRFTGITASMEYRMSGADGWSEGTGRDVTGLTPGTYHVRVKATDSVLASDYQVLEVGECVRRSVALTGGAHATPAPEAGVSQTLAQGDQMATVTYTAKDGYEFPATSEHYRAMNGITVARTSDTVVTVSGTPTADASVTVPGAVARTYVVTLDNQDATTAGDESVTATYGSAMPQATMPTRTGYTFGGYWDGKNGAGMRYYGADGKSAHVWDKAADATLYAQWVPMEYAVTLDNQGATTTGASSVTATYGTALPGIAYDLPAKAGHTFGGYFSQTNGGGTQYLNADGTATENTWLTDGPGTLYAKWTANPKEDMPTVTFTATGADIGTLSGVEAGMRYSLDGGATWKSISSRRNISLTGLSAGTIQVVRKGDDTTTVDSDAQIIAVTKAATPTTPHASDCATIENNDGRLIGVTSSMEYQKSDADGWTAGNGDDVTGLAPGTYYVRTKPDGNALASGNLKLTIKRFISATVTFKVSNGSWADGTKADKPVTLTGHEGDTLRLGATDIPAVGGRPDDTYKAGSWDTVPTTSAAIAKDTTYTYVYAKKDSISATVTFHVVDGSWNDGSTAYKVVTLKGYESDTLRLEASDIPAVGAKPDRDYKAGSWDIVPTTSAAITGDTTYTYTYARKDAATITATPMGRSLTYDGTPQALVVAGVASGGTMQYALGDSYGPTRDYGTEIPTATSAGTYYVWYRAAGDGYHTDSDADYVTAVIEEETPTEGEVHGGVHNLPGAPRVLESNIDAVAGAIAEPIMGEGDRGRDVELWLESRPIEDGELTAYELQSLLGRAAEVGADESDVVLFDLSLWMRVGDGEKVAIHETAVPVTFRVEVPGWVSGRTYYLYRLHGGVVSLVATTTLSYFDVSGSEFSAYTIAGVDAQGPEPTPTPEPEPEPEPTPTPEPDPEPDPTPTPSWSPWTMPMTFAWPTFDWVYGYGGGYWGAGGYYAGSPYDPYYETSDTYYESDDGKSAAQVTRIAGADRYATAAAVSAEGFTSSSVAVVATGSSFPDALAASALAGAYGAPIVLTDDSALSSQAASELRRLGVTDVLVMGGASAVSDAVVFSIESMGIRVGRVSGADRFESAVQAFKSVRAASRASDTVVVASGTGFADALSIGPWAWATKSPVLLARPDGTLPQSAVDAIAADGGIRRVVIVGGTSSVPDAIRTQLGSAYTYERLGGSDRYETSRLVAAFAAREGMSWSTVGVATGTSFPDALAASALIGKRGGVLLLTDASGSSVAGELRSHASAVERAYVFGGISAVSESVVERISEALS